MPRARSGQIEIEYETFGDPSHPALLLVMGLGAQLVLWDEELCRQLAARGFYVIRYDNRDVGLSTKMRSHVSGVRMVCALIRAAFGGAVRAPYTLSDMAGDAVGLLDALGIRAAHLMGSSMGGMIAQLLAIEHPERVLSLVSVSSTSSDPAIPQAPREALSRLSFPPPMHRTGYVAHTVELQRFLNGPVLPFDEERARRRSGEAFDRGVDIMGAGRHFLAQLAATSRKEALARVTAPTLVVHGDVDPVSSLDCARSTAEAVPGAELMIVPGMGHDLSPPVWSSVIDAIVRNARRADERGARAAPRAAARQPRTVAG